MLSYSALTTLPGEAPSQALADALELMDPAPTGVGVFEIEDGSGLWEVGAYYLEQPDDVVLHLLAAAHDAKPFAVSEIPETDWVSAVRRELTPVHAGRFVASDIDPIATETAKANVAANGLRGRVQCLTSVGFRHTELHKRAPYDLIFANILAGPLKKLAPEMAEHSESGTVLILSGIQNYQAKGVANTYEGFGFAVIVRRVIGEWTTITLRKA